MAEQDRAPMIQLPIDQEVYMESIHEGTIVEDATVATEIVSFERIGDAYVLEGAVVFAGYVSSDLASDKRDVTGGDKEVEHIHQRLPFILRVPTRAQGRGILNVKSRLSGWKLSVASPGWLRVQGDLQVAGLSADEGYHFECGGQQLGHPMFDMQFRGIEDEEAYPDSGEDSGGLARGQKEDVSENEDDSTSQEDDSSMLRHAKPASSVEQSVQFMSAARGGHGLEENQVPDTGTPVSGSSESENSEFRAADELEKFDRYFADERETQQRTVAEFDFEHQLSPEEMIQFEEAPPSPKTLDETFVASRSFLDAGFHPAAGFSQTFVDESQQWQQTEHLAVEETSDPVEHEARAENGYYGDSLWSFVDFNAPEKKHTLRYIIVMDEETLETVAERIHCTKSELVRVNKLDVESIEPGQILLVPEVPFTFSK